MKQKRSKRLKINYEYVIHDWKLDSEFEKYLNLHPDIRSRKRLARSFLTGLDLKRVYTLPCYIVGQEEPYLCYISRLIQEKKIIVED